MRYNQTGSCAQSMLRRNTRCALLFAGQGSERQGALAGLAEHLPGFATELERALACLPSAQRSALEAVRAGDVTPLGGRTDLVQLYLAAVHAALVRCLDAAGLRFDAYAGHSFGELSALHAAGAIETRDYVYLAGARGAAMQRCASARPGRLYAVRADAERARDFLAEAGVGYLANLNSAEQTVLGVAEEHAGRLEGLLVDAGLAFRLLPTAGAFHTPLMGEAAAEFAQELARLRPVAARAPVYSGRLGRAYRADDVPAEHLAAQICEPLRWREVLHALWDDGVRVFVDAGPGRVLSGLVRRELPEAEVISLDGSDAAAVQVAWRRLQALAAPLPAAAAAAGPDPVMIKYLEQQDVLLGLLAEVPAAERAAVASEWLQQTGSVMQAYLDTALARTGAAAPSPALAAPEPAAVAAVPAETDTLAWLRERVAQLTGHPLEMITPEAELENELGVDSVSLLELWHQLLERRPELAGREDELARCRSLAALAAWIDGAAPAPEPAPLRQAVAQPATVPALPRDGADASAVLSELAAALAGQARADVAPEQDWYEDLGLDPFVVEGLLHDLIERNPRLAFAGEALLGCSSLAQVARVVEGLGETGVDNGLPLWRDRWSTAAPSAPRSVDRGSHALVRLGEGEPALPCDVDWRLVGGELRGDGCGWNEDALLALDSALRERLSASRWTFQVDPGAAPAALGQRLRTVHALLRALQAQGLPRRIQVLLHSAAGADAAALRGLFKSVRKEWSGTEFVILSGYEQVHDLPAQLARCGGNADLRAGERGLEQYALEPVRLSPGRTPLLRAGDTVLVTGGGRGVGAEMVRELARLAPCRIVVVGRTAMPGAEPHAGEDPEAVQRRLRAEGLSAAAQRERLREIEAQRALFALRREVEVAGARFDYLSLDLAAIDAERLAAALRPFGPLHGVIHAAGLTRDARLEQKSASDFDAVFAAKAGSWQALEPYLRTQPLRFAYLISSLAAVDGTPGQGDYCAANELLNASARVWARQADFPVAAIAFGPWTETGLVSPAFRQQMQRLGLAGIRSAEGRATLRQLLHCPEARGWLLACPHSTLDYALGRSAA